ncbi:MAG: hypothetical protein Q4A54_13305 [Parabacteroides sp.]|nr:hypothetical protein [Parabacteroides sp.]
MMVKIGKKHLSKLYLYDVDDYIQEGTVVLWRLIQSRKYDGKRKFSNLFYSAFEHKCINLYRDYVLKNMVQLYTGEDYYNYGYRVVTLVEDEYVQQYREKQRERNKRWYEKTHGTSPKAPKLSEEERKERNRQRAREYYLRNKEKCQEAKRRWYRENREYALEYQRAYGQSIRTGINDFEKRRK